MGKLILEILQQMYGSKFVRDLIGTRTNVVKPKQFDSNAPTKNTYSEDAFKDPKLLDTIEEKLIEYAPFQITNRSRREQENYLANLKKLRDARKKEQGITAQTESVKEVKPEAEVFDLGTKKKVGDEGIMTLKSEIGLPKGVEPGSLADKAIKESAEYKMRQQGVESLLDPKYKAPKTSTIDEDEAFEFEKFDKDPRRPGGPLDPAVGITRAGARLILENKNIKIGSKDPLDLVRENFGQDFLNDINNISEEMLEIDRRGGSYKDLTDLLKREGLYDAPINKDAPKGYTTEEMKKIMDEADEKDLGDKLKDLDDDIPDMAEGGRIGFAAGAAKGLLKLMQSKLGKDNIKMADEVELTEDMKIKNQTRRALDELQDYKEVAPQFFTRMTLKLKYPGISDELIAKIMADDDPQRIAEVMATMDEAFKMMDKGMSTDEILKAFKTTPRTKNAGGGLSYLMGM
tara:strand:+ start:75 stop:1451 length:1377 start_codon:yes stop_codon:yes gene_type:complete